jgi:peptidoglycan/LPS O-acetylase OafA/YrhL
MVALGHLAQLSDVQAFAVFSDWTNASMAVHGFFVISGFLIYRSYHHLPVWKEYLKKRFRRILPAYILVVGVAALALVLVSDKGILEYYTSAQWWKYVLYNLLTLNFLQSDLPGVFQHNPFNIAVNGSLWTIKIEIGFYLFLPLLVHALSILKESQRSWALLGLLAFSLLYAEFFLWLYQTTGNEFYSFLHRQLPGKLCYFISGILAYRHWNFFQQHPHTIGILSFFLVAASWYLQVDWLSVFSLAGLLIWMALIAPPVFAFLDKHDYSYGIYLWHYPLVQIFTSQQWWQHQEWTMFLLWIFALLLISAVSWYGLERRYIRKGKQA